MTVTTEAARLVSSSDGRFQFRMPRESDLDQDEEWIAVRNGEGWQKFRLHDYDTIYRTPGLYEAIVYDVLGCRSPSRLVQLFDHVLANWPTEPGDLRVLDLGAGNGIVGERLRNLGVERLVGIDILEGAAAAAKRDRPDTYDDYIVADLCHPGPEDLERIRRQQPNALFTVAALGFGDIPPAVFRTAFNAIETPGWLALTIKEEFLESGSNAGFSGLLRRMVQDGTVSEEARLRIRHRTSIAGEPIFYVAIIARKLEDIPARLLN